jgi:hypothetical protein
MWKIFLTSSLKNITNSKHTLTPHQILRQCQWLPLGSTQHIAWDESWTANHYTSQWCHLNKHNVFFSMNWFRLTSTSLYKFTRLMCSPDVFLVVNLLIIIIRDILLYILYVSVIIWCLLCAKIVCNASSSSCLLNMLTHGPIYEKKISIQSFL